MRLKILLEVMVETNTEDTITTTILQDIYEHFNAALIDDINNSDYCDVDKLTVRSIIKLKDKALESV
jgi:hypothetical protein